MISVLVFVLIFYEMPKNVITDFLRWTKKILSSDLHFWFHTATNRLTYLSFFFFCCLVLSFGI